MNSVTLISFLVSHFTLLQQVEGLICAKSCAFGPVPFGTSNPIRTPCATDTIDTQTSVCSVYLDINFGTAVIRGSLRQKSRTGSESSAVDISYFIIPTRTTLSITFTCTTTDNCEQEFLNQTVSSSGWSRFNDTKLRAQINELLLRTDSPTDEVICANNQICSPEAHCHAELVYNSSALSNDQKTIINNDFPCDNTSIVELSLKQHFTDSIPKQQDTMNIFCNQKQCNDPSIVGEVYQLFQKDFRLPLNYSAYQIDTSHSWRIVPYWINILFIFFLLKIS